MKLNKQLVFGVGYNDADYVTDRRVRVIDINGKVISRSVWKCPFYKTWKHMLERSYYPQYKNRFPTYENVRVCDDWLIFSKFKLWMEHQDWEGKTLDKDLMQEGGHKIYSPSTCIFISSKLNSFLSERTTKLGAYPTGVSWHKRVHKYAACCSDGNSKNKHLGYFTSPDDAHVAWCRYKLQLAEKLLIEEGLPDVLAVKVLSIFQNKLNAASSIMERAYDYEGDEIELTEVFAKSKVITVYEIN